MLDLDFQQHMNCIGGIMVSMLALSVVDRGFESRSGLTNDYKIGSCSSPLSMQHSGEGAKTGWLGIRIMCPSGETVSVS